MSYLGTLVRAGLCKVVRGMIWGKGIPGGEAARAGALGWEHACMLDESRDLGWLEQTESWRESGMSWGPDPIGVLF